MARLILVLIWLLLGVPAAAQPASSPLAGRWTADMSRSTPSPDLPLRTVVLDITVSKEMVSIADHHVYASGKEQKGTHTFQADGVAHPFEAPALGTGVLLTATWKTARTLDTIVTKDGKEITRVVYEVSPDGRTMTATRTGAYAQRVTFDRKLDAREVRGVKRRRGIAASPPLAFNGY